MPNFSCTWFNVLGLAHETFGIWRAYVSILERCSPKKESTKKRKESEGPTLSDFVTSASCVPAHKNPQDAK